MMKYGSKNIIFLIWTVLIIQLVWVAPAAAQTMADSSGLFDNGILQSLHLLMVTTYKTIGKVLMIGHALMCYAINVNNYSLFDLLNIPDPTFLFVGGAIYVAGIFISLSVGMYFVDASLRLGIAIIFMPISIALWPFPPTSSKFMDNLNTIIRNGLLFALMSVGISFALCLINAGLFESGDAAFWSAIEHQQTELLSENFSFFSTHILVVGFSLIYGFRLLESSVNNYLNAFFSDPMFGSQSPMNQMGTQAFGMVSQNMVKPAASLAKDIAMHQTGRAIGGIGTAISAEGRSKIAGGIKNVYSGLKTFAKNPRQTYNQAMATAGKKANDAIQSVGQKAENAIFAAGEGAKKLADGISAMAPIPLSEDIRQDRLQGKLENGKRPVFDENAGFRGNKGINNKIDYLTNKFGKFARNNIDAVTPAVGNFTENVLAHGGGEINNAVRTAEEGAKQWTADKIADTINQVNAMRGSEDPAVSGDQIRAGVRNAGIIAGAKLNKLADKVIDSDIVQGFKEGAATADQAPITLEPLAAVSAPFKAVRHPIKTCRKLANLSESFNNYKQTLKENRELTTPTTGNSGGNAQQTLENSQPSRTRIIMKATGQIVARTAKDVGSKTENVGKYAAKAGKATSKPIGKAAGKTADALGKTLQDFGAWLGDNSKRGGQRDNSSWLEKWNSVVADKKAREEEAQEESDYYREMSGGDN